MTFNKSAALLVSFLLSLGVLSDAALTQTGGLNETRTVAFLADGRTEESENKIALIKDEIINVVNNRYPINFIDYKILNKSIIRA